MLFAAFSFNFDGSSRSCLPPSALHSLPLITQREAPVSQSASTVAALVPAMLSPDGPVMSTMAVICVGGLEDETVVSAGSAGYDVRRAGMLRELSGRRGWRRGRHRRLPGLACTRLSAVVLVVVEPATILALVSLEPVRLLAILSAVAGATTVPAPGSGSGS